MPKIAKWAKLPKHLKPKVNHKKVVLDCLAEIEMQVGPLGMFPSVRAEVFRLTHRARVAMKELTPKGGLV